jgi:hypothetical protein
MSSEYSGQPNVSKGCEWYGNACPDRTCSEGNGFTRCKVRMRGVVFNKLEGEYRKLRSKNPEISNTLCWSFSPLEKRVSSSGVNVSV